MVTDTSAPRALALLAHKAVPTTATALIKTPAAASEDSWAPAATSIVVAADTDSAIRGANASAI